MNGKCTKTHLVIVILCSHSAKALIKCSCFFHVKSVLCLHKVWSSLVTINNHTHNRGVTQWRAPIIKCSHSNLKMEQTSTFEKVFIF